MDPITRQPTLFNPAELVTEDKVHSAIYTSDEIFELEIERIFHRTWMYLGHHSEVPNAGDYQVRQIGRQSVIMVRGEDGQVRALMNRCSHRGMAVCETEGHVQDPQTARGGRASELARLPKQWPLGC